MALWAVLSDIHGNAPALRAVLEDARAQGATAFIHLGDALSGPLQVAETADVLMALDAAGCTTIAGNHERQLLAAWAMPVSERDPLDGDAMAAAAVSPAHLDWLRRLPAQARLPDAADVLLVHGTPASDLQYNLETVPVGPGGMTEPGLRAATASEVSRRFGGVSADVALVLCGHTHVPRACWLPERDAGRPGLLVLNPGSVGLQAYDDVHPQAHVVENGTPHASYALVWREPPRAGAGAGAAHGAGWAWAHRRVPYDWEASARLAAARGRSDWAHALRTGRMPPGTFERLASRAHAPAAVSSATPHGLPQP